MACQTTSCSIIKLITQVKSVLATLFDHMVNFSEDHFLLNGAILKNSAHNIALWQAYV